MKIGLIGTGNMGSAIVKGYLAANPGKEKDVFAFDQDKARLKTLAKELGICDCNDGVNVVTQSDVLILAVKPDKVAEVLQEIAPFIDWEEKVLVSIAAGVSIGFIESLCNEHSGYKEKTNDFRCKVVRVMPNTPALVGKGMSALCRNSQVSEEEFKHVLDLFSSVGKSEEVDEKLMDCVVGVSGSSPAYVYLFIEALADGAVAQGMSRKQAYTFAAQSVLGSAEMVLKTDIHPGELKDMVCSPGGTTIEAVKDLERNGFRYAVMEAVRVASDKSKAMKK
ncbi:MAG: pyrroline-5-carboxylate reductase [Eubacteriales bacterium]|nr:pyrroline-5-carboxylate reductase [Methanosarcina sp.]MDD4583287.1 pyrroline-5-carboxylate reductase [Eubacteriales bacterium]